MSELVERVARAICGEWGYNWKGDPEDDQTAPEVHEGYDERPSKRLYRRAARAAIAAMRDPTKEMLDATGLRHGAPLANWHAMIDAALVDGTTTEKEEKA